MKIRMLYFASVRERAGCDAEEYELPTGASLAELRAALIARHPAVEVLLRHVRWAHNERFVPRFDGGLEAGVREPVGRQAGGRPINLADGDVVALIPPVAGGAPPVGLTAEPLDPRGVEAQVAHAGCGAIVTFIGTVRDHTAEHAVERLEYEAYESMAVRVLEDIVAEVEARWPGVRVAIRHRTGLLAVGEAAVVIAVSAAHRADAFAACAHTIDRLKEDVPIFKREVRTDGSVWVGHGP